MNKDELRNEENQNGQKQENYMALGMCFGIMAGSVAMLRVLSQDGVSRLSRK